MRCPLRSPRHGSCRSRGPSRALNRAPWRCCGFGCRGGGDAHASEPDLAEALQLRDVLLLGRDALVAVVAVRVVGEGPPAALTARSQISRSGATGRTNPCMPGRQAVLDRRARRHAPRAAVWGARHPTTSARLAASRAATGLLQWATRSVRQCESPLSQCAKRESGAFGGAEAFAVVEWSAKGGLVT